MNNNFVLIMAGGEGERFWPYSTSDFPKQFLALFDEESMIEKTFNRMKKLVPLENIFISTNERFFELTKQFLPDIPENNIITEPEKRNTFPAMALFLATLKKRVLNGTVIMVAADHIIENEKLFLNTCENAFEIAEKDHKIVTFGIVPTRIETNFGYLKPENAVTIHGIEVNENVHFFEKPNFEKAKKFYESGQYFWNSGIFTFNMEILLNEIKNIIPRDFGLINDFINNKIAKDEFFFGLTKNSIDFVIMERSDNISMLRSNFDWDDIGNWDALLRFTDNNFIKGNIEFNELSNSVIISDNYKIIGENFKNLIFIEKNNNILISDLNGLQYIKKGLKNKREKNRLIQMEECSNIKLDNFNQNTFILGVKDLHLEMKDNIIRIFKI
ncbi:mannose-1-phosphate guanylyltransferase [bacterium]|nr:mannose-1-phosphate guanylyltransferase [bacterium]